jgi:hypothetical protein
MARDSALRGLPVCVVLAAGRGDDHVQNRLVRAVKRVVVVWRGHVEIIRTTMPCVGSPSVWSSLRGEAMTTFKIGKYGPLTGLSSPGVGMLRSFEPHPPSEEA